jgi:transposase
VESEHMVALVPDDLVSLSRDDLLTLITRLVGVCEEQAKRIAELEAVVEKQAKQIAQLEAQLGKGGPPPFVKENKPPREQKERKRRSQHFSRLRETPTEVAVHVPECCPDCGRKLSGGWLQRSRQVIEIEPTPVKIIDHVILARYCGVCNRRVLPKVDLSDQVVGKHRVGIGLMSWIAYLHVVGRMPLRTIQRLLALMFGLHLGIGELSEVLHTVSDRGTGLRAELLRQVRGSPFVHADETGWREDGQNGYLWSFSTPEVRYYSHNKSRAGVVAEEVLGEDFSSILVSDFYGGYNRFLCPKQRCWVHFLRDLHKLREASPQSGPWIDSVEAVYERAKAYQRRCREGKTLDCGVFDRHRMRQALEDDLQDLARPYIRPQCQEPQPQSVLAQRIETFLKELFTFVTNPDVPSENNAAERSIRPAVITRKVCGGTRSEKGSQTKATLLTLFGTWIQNNLNPMQQCRTMLATAK